MPPDIEDVLRALGAVVAPDGRPLGATVPASSVHVSGSTVIVVIPIAPGEAGRFEPVRTAAEAALRALPGVDKALVGLTAEKVQGPAKPQSPTAPQTGRRIEPIRGIRKIIAVASGKGGVGKSTTAVNLALALKRRGLAVGMLDADVYGPSLPKLLGLEGKPELVGGRLQPLVGHGLPTISMGFMVDSATPLIWRGPMIDSALTQMLREVDWGALDVLVVDMPPGTGDAQLTMAQKVPLDGAVIVSTPQDLALIDARKGIAMFGKVDVPILGLIENMSTFICPHCGFRCDIFAHGGAKAEAEKHGARFLGEVPLHMDIRRNADAGRPSVVADPDGPHALAYAEIAARLWSAL